MRIIVGYYLALWLEVRKFVAMKKVAIITMLMALAALTAIRADEPPRIVVSILETPGNVIEMPAGLLKRLEPRNEPRPDVQPEQKPETTSPEPKSEPKPRVETTKTERTEVRPQRNQPQSVQGYRVQVFSDNNAHTAKSNAQAMQKRVAGRFPQYRSSIRYTAPYWRVRVGDFKTAAEANNAAAAIKRAFPSQAAEIRVVRERVYVVN